jgi:hypothetical protein
MNNPDHISESLETIFWVKILKFFDADPGSGMEKIRIRDKHPGSTTLDIKVEKRCIHQVVGTANQPHLARQLIEFLLTHRKQTVFCGKMSSFT